MATPLNQGSGYSPSGIKQPTNRQASSNSRGGPIGDDTIARILNASNMEALNRENAFALSAQDASNYDYVRKIIDERSGYLMGLEKNAQTKPPTVQDTAAAGEAATPPPGRLATMLAQRPAGMGPGVGLEDVPFTKARRTLLGA